MLLSDIIWLLYADKYLLDKAGLDKAGPPNFPDGADMDNIIFLILVIGVMHMMMQSLSLSLPLPSSLLLLLPLLSLSLLSDCHSPCHHVVRVMVIWISLRMLKNGQEHIPASWVVGTQHHPGCSPYLNDSDNVLVICCPSLSSPHCCWELLSPLRVCIVGPRPGHSMPLSLKWCG